MKTYIWVSGCLAAYMFLGIMTLSREGLFGALLGIILMVFVYTCKLGLDVENGTVVFLKDKKATL